MIGDERIAMEARLVFILMNVVTPPHFSGTLIERVKGASQGADRFVETPSV